jgi:hypothetical protein
MDGEFMLQLGPLAMILSLFWIAILAMVLRHRAHERLHQERMTLAEKGLEIPGALYPGAARPSGDLRTARAWLLVLGTVMTFIGVAVMITIGVQEGLAKSTNGVAPLAIGLGLLTAEKMLVRALVRSGNGNGARPPSVV